MASNRNLDLPAPVDDLLTGEREAGSTITGTVSAALFWYFKRLTAGQRELARLECRDWIETGQVPPSDIVTVVEQALQNARERGSRRSRPQSKGA